METALDVVKQYLLTTCQTRLEGKELRMNSPLRAGSDSHSFRFNTETGEYYDHVSGQKGNAVTLARELGLDLPARKPVENSLREYTSLADYAKQKGVPESVFTTADWKVINYQQRPAIEFTTKGGNRYRFLDGAEPKFKSVMHYKTCWYGLDRAINMAKATNAPALVICNGEPSVLVAQHFGIPAFAKTGGEGNAVPYDLVLELQSKWTGMLIVALDCDTAGRKGAEIYRRTLTGAGFQFRIVDLGLEDKGDLADLCKLYTTDALDALLKCADMGVKVAAEVAKPTQDLESALRELAAARKAENGGNLTDLLNRVQREIDALKGVKPLDVVKDMSDIVSEHEAWLAAAIASGGTVQGVSTGITKLDEYIGGGLAFGTVTVILASTSQGKSTLMASAASEMINQAPGLIVGTETKGRALLNRIIAYRMRITTDVLRRGQITERQLISINNIRRYLKEENIAWVEASNPTPKQVFAAAERAVKEHGCKWAIIDSLSNIGGEDSDGGIFENVSGASDVALELARMDLAVLATSQVGRSMKERKVKIPTKHDGKGSGRIEENADLLLALYNHDHYVRTGELEADGNYPPGTVLLRLLKDREGEVPGHGINLQFRGGMGIYDLNGGNQL